MQRRESLRLLAGALVLGGLTPDELFALGTRVHARLRARGDAAGLALDAHRLATLEAAVDLIIPTTDTPGAAAAGVHAFIDLLLADWFGPEERARFIAGMDDLDARSRSRGGRAFLEADNAVRTALLTELDDEAVAVTGAAAERPFFRCLKELTLFGYYTSRIGVEQELRWVGRDAASSVLNAHNQLWDAPNVFVTDGACMTSAGCQNPSITYMALTARAAAHAVDALNRHEL